MNSRERMIRTLRFEPVDRAPHFESMFELSEEAFGVSFPPVEAWAAYGRGEKERQINLCMDIYERMIERYQWDALSVYYPWGDADGVKAARKRFGNDLLIGAMVGKSIWSIENIDEEAGDWMNFSIMLADEPERCHQVARKLHDGALLKIRQFVDAGADFIFQPNDVGFNSGPFVSPPQFREFCFPYWKEQVQYTKKNGLFSFIHTDGQVTSLLDDLIATGADCFQSVDPMAGMDIAEVKKRCHGQMALMGNVQCSLLQDGPEEAIRRSALYALESCGRDSGYIFSSSNTIFKGLPLGNYEYMLNVYRGFYR